MGGSKVNQLPERHGDSVMVVVGDGGGANAGHNNSSNSPITLVYITP